MIPPASKRPREIGDQTFAAILLTPAFLFVACLAIYPIIRVIWLSFFTQNLGTELHPQFTGITNYTRLLNDGHYFAALRTTLIFTFFAVSSELILGMTMALLLNETFRGRSIARAAALVPWALPTAVLALAWKWVFNDQFGVFNDLLMRLHLISHPIAWLGTPATALFSLIFADVWKTTPFMMILLLAGLQDIPNELYEAAHIDGARSINSFRLITLPMLLPSITLALLFRSLQSFGIFDLPFVMTGGGPGGATETVGIYTYNTYLRYLDFGYGSAMIVGTTLVMAFIAILIYLPLSRSSGARA
ncbi:MAG TPA: sugar ABC transporter permease [Tepidisphaeraceae bacterium]|jgi:multiple sugar transport system permease protein|nr:sugar ABC transporter permease [Tepidisphaeraceae bacterium]